MARSLVTAIDIGSAHVRVATSEILSSNGLLRILATAEIPSRGIRFGHVVNGAEAAGSLMQAMREVENKIGTRVKSASVSLSGDALGTTLMTSSIAVSRADGEITDLDVERVVAESEVKMHDQANVRVIHTIPTEFRVDGKKIIGKPHGMHGSKLEARVLFITSATTHFKKLIKVIESTGIEVEDIFAGPIAESIVTASNLQKNAGCVIANVGASTVSVIVFEENIPRTLEVFKLGGNDITNDIALGLKIPIEQAEKIKLSGSVSNVLDNPKITDKKINDIIEARLSDIFELIDGHLKKIHRSGLLPAGIIITGGSAHLREMCDLAKKHLKLPASVGNGTDKLVARPKPGTVASGRTPNENRATYETITRPEWSVIYGLSALGSELESEDSLGLRIAKTTKNQVVRWFKQFLP